LESRPEGILPQLAFRSVLLLAGDGNTVANRTADSTPARLAHLSGVMAYDGLYCLLNFLAVLSCHHAEEHEVFRQGEAIDQTSLEEGFF
jgi:hypothetical protein